MTAGELLKRIWSALSQVPFGRLAAPEFMDEEELGRVRRTALTVSQWPLLIDESAAVTPDYILANAKLVRRKHNTKLLAVDYLQRISFPGSKKDLFAEVGDTARRFAELAKTEGMAVMLLSSLTEKSGSGANTPPSLTDLRNSGDIQYHAHRAYLIHRDRDEGTISPNAVFIVAKNRHGRTGAVDAVFNPNSLLFEDVDGGKSHVM
jgi:replicative DNA helicase